MSSETLLRGDGLTKTYYLTGQPLRRLRAALFGVRPTDAAKTVLDGVDISVRRGETVGVIGRNGAGKSTLLSILGEVARPTSGQVRRRGKTAVLLELGAGFDQNLSGRENAAAYCRLMGVPRGTVAHHLDQIREFADLDEYFDLPIRTYSSGMQARLSFAAAIHVDADLIIVDETLAVGDAAFKVKCYARIKRMQQTGSSFLLVSHSPNLVANFCTRVVILEHGRKVFDGDTVEGIKRYKEIRVEAERRATGVVAPVPSTAVGEALRLENFRHREFDVPYVGSMLAFEGDLVAAADTAPPVVHIGLRDSQGITLASFTTADLGTATSPMRAGERRSFRLTVRNSLLPGMYFMSAALSEIIGDVERPVALLQDLLRLEIVGKAASRGIVDLHMAFEWGTTGPPPTNASPSTGFDSRSAFSPDTPYLIEQKERAPLLHVFRTFTGWAQTRCASGDWDGIHNVECGVFRGRSLLACALMSRSLAPAARFTGLDTFSGFPEFSDTDRQLVGQRVRDAGAVFADNSLEAVRQLMEREGVSDRIELLPGRFDQTLPTLPERKYAFVHIDCDLYEPHLECLTYFYPRMHQGGIIFLDDYHSAEYPVAKAAVDRFLKDKPERLFHIRYADDAPNHSKAFLVKF